MRRTIKYALCLLCALVCIVSATLIYLTYFFSADSLRQHLGAVLSAKTGYSVQLRQSAHISFFPQFKASLYAIELTAPKSTRSHGLAPLMRAQRIDLELSFVEAMRGHLEFSNIKIIKPQFFLARPVYDVGLALAKIFNPSSNMRQKLATITIEDGSIFYSAENLLAQQNTLNNDPSKLTNIMAQLSFGGPEQQPYLQITGKSKAKDVSLQSHIIVRGKKSIGLPDITLVADKVKLRGALQLAFGVNPCLTGSIAVEDLNMLDFLQSLWRSYITAKSQKKELIDLDLRLSANEAHYKKLAVKNLAVTLQANTKTLRLGIGNVETPYGIMTGNINNSITSDKTKIEATFNARKANLAVLDNSIFQTKAYGSISLKATSSVKLKNIGADAQNILSAIIANMATSATITSNAGKVTSAIIPALDRHNITVLQEDQIIDLKKRAAYEFKNLKIEMAVSPAQTKISAASLCIGGIPAVFSAIVLPEYDAAKFAVKTRINYVGGAGGSTEFWLLNPECRSEVHYLTSATSLEKYNNLDKNFRNFITYNNQKNNQKTIVEKSCAK